MRILGMVLMAAVAGAAGDNGQVVAVCMNRGANAPKVFRAQAMVSKIFSEIGVALSWRDDPKSCAAPGGGIVIRLSNRTPAQHHPGKLAYAMPFGSAAVEVYYDRVEAAGLDSLLTYVLAHEIGHVLQGSDGHSAAGIMKKKWDRRDYAEMRISSLQFTEGDVQLIHLGMEAKKKADE